MSDPRPILFACGGGSNAGRLSHDVARTLDASGDTETCCLAGAVARKAHFHNKLADRSVWVAEVNSPRVGE
jgi:uncharacterized metal-binding protein